MKQLVINPGSTSTKIGVFEDLELIFEKTLRHDVSELQKYENIVDEIPFRLDIILKALEEHQISVDSLSAIVGRGGLLKPIPGGTYEINEKMLHDLRSGFLGQHASNIGGILANEIAKKHNRPSFIVDPVVVDELEPIARIAGHPRFERKSIFHALNQKAVARRAAKEMGKTYESCGLIVVHLGGGISVGAHRNGQVVDVNNALDGEGPFSPERSGTLPCGDLLKVAYSGEVSHDEMKKMLKGNGGLTAYLGTNNAKLVSDMCKEGDSNACLIYEAMAYQVAKSVGANAAVLEGNVDAIIITGGIAYDQQFVEWIKKRVNFIAKVLVYPGEDELTALAEGGLRILNGEEEARIYE